MLPKLTRPLVVFDLETTGLDVATARIIQLSYIKVEPDGQESRQALFINPQCPIPEVVQQLTHITPEMVSNAPTFREIAPQLAETFANCDFAGYNSNHYDVPVLAEEFMRAGINFDFSTCNLLDAMVIFQHMEKRTLAAAYKFYCGRKMEDDFQAHRADEDTEATWRVLQAQLDYYAPGRQDEAERTLTGDMSELARASKHGNNIDFAGRFVWKEQADGTSIETFNFGKHKGKAVTDVLRSEPSYFAWMMQGDFTQDTKLVLARIKAAMK